MPQRKRIALPAAALSSLPPPASDSSIFSTTSSSILPLPTPYELAALFNLLPTYWQCPVSFLLLYRIKETTQDTGMQSREQQRFLPPPGGSAFGIQTLEQQSSPKP